MIFSQNGQHQEDRLLRHRRGVDSGVVAHIGPRCVGGLKIDLVIAHAEGLDDLQLPHAPDDLPVQGKHRINENGLGLCSGKGLWIIVPIPKMHDFPVCGNLAAIRGKIIFVY